MGLTGDRYIGTYAGHQIELVRDNWNKTLNLLIDGTQVASASRVLPHDITLTGTFDDGGAQHTVVATSRAHFLTAEDAVEVDGIPLALSKTQ